MKKIIFVLLCLALLFACELVEERESLAAVAALTVEAGGEMLTITWPSVPHASSYRLRYTSNGEVPNSESAFVDVEGTSYEHRDLEADQTYKYMVESFGSGYKSSMSPVTSGHVPLPIFTLTGDFGESGGNDILVLFLEVPYNEILEEVEGPVAVLKTLVVTPKSDGTVTASTSFDRAKYLGFAVAIDNDGSGTLTAHDMVTGSGGSGSYGYSFFKSKFNKSFEIEANWFDYEATHLY